VIATTADTAAIVRMRTCLPMPPGTPPLRNRPSIHAAATAKTTPPHRALVDEMTRHATISIATGTASASGGLAGLSHRRARSISSTTAKALACLDPILRPLA